MTEDSGAVTGPEDAIKNISKKLTDKEKGGATLTPNQKSTQQKAQEVDTTEKEVSSEVQKGADEYVKSLKTLQTDIQKSRKAV